MHQLAMLVKELYHCFKHLLALLWVTYILICVERDIEIRETKGAMQDVEDLIHLLYRELTIAQIQIGHQVIVG